MRVEIRKRLAMNTTDTTDYKSNDASVFECTNSFLITTLGGSFCVHSHSTDEETVERCG